MNTLRILIASMPRMMREMITQILMGEPDIVVVGAIDPCSDLISAVRRSEADLLIVGQQHLTNTEELQTVLSSIYPTRILAITPNAQYGILHVMKPHCEVLADISAAGLVAAIRTTFRSRRSASNLQ